LLSRVIRGGSRGRFEGVATSPSMTRAERYVEKQQIIALVSFAPFNHAFNLHNLQSPLSKLTKKIYYHRTDPLGLSTFAFFASTYNSLFPKSSIHCCLGVHTPKIAKSNNQ